jgi:hypothetical protein
MERILEGFLAIQEKRDTLVSRMDARLKGKKDCPGAMEVLSKRKKATTEMTNVAAHPEDSNGTTREETIGATEDRSRDRRLAVRRRGRPEKRTQGDCGSRQKLAAAPGRLTHRALPACRKGRSHKRPMVEKRRWEGPKCINGLKDQLRLGGKKAFNKTIRQTLGLEVAKRAVEFSIWLRKMSGWTLWRTWSPPRQKKVLLLACVPSLKEHRPLP